jgi:hypothetical protein
MNEELKKYLSSLEFDEEEIQEILIFAGNEIDTKVLKDKVEYLVEIGCTPRIIRIIIEENPLLFTTTLSDIKKMVEYLVTELNLKDDLVQILEVEPCILSTKLENVKRNIKMLSLLINKELMYTLYLDRMEIFTYDPDYLSIRLAYLIKKGLKDEIYNIIINNIEIFEENIEEIDIENLKK